jgi:hypothetical protein
MPEMGGRRPADSLVASPKRKDAPLEQLQQEIFWSGELGSPIWSSVRSTNNAVQDLTAGEVGVSPRNEVITIDFEQVSKQIKRGYHHKVKASGYIIL